MNNININNGAFPIQEKDYIDVCENLKKRVFRILYLKDDLIAEAIKDHEVTSYINALVWDIYGAYVVFGNYKFLNCICELEGIKENIREDFARKKVLDLASFISSIPTKRE